MHHLPACSQLAWPSPATAPGARMNTGSVMGVASTDAVDCKGEWSVWNACSRTCSGGIQQQRFVVTTGAEGAGTPCNTPNNAILSRSCNTSPCRGGHSCPAPLPVGCAGMKGGSLPSQRRTNGQLFVHSWFLILDIFCASVFCTCM